MDDSITTEIHQPGAIMDAPVAEEAKAGPAAQAPRRMNLDWKAIVDSPAFIPGLALTIGFVAVFWYMIANLPTIWMGDDGYYSHGFLVPLISGYVIYRWWPRIKDIPVKPAYLAVVPLLFILWVARASTVNQIDSLTSACMIAALVCGTAFIAGWRWMLALFLPTAYLAFALPLWNMAITVYTNPLQVYSTKVAYKMLELTGFAPIRGGDGGNIIYLQGFTLDVGVPCSGLKLVLALAAFTVFFMFIGNLRWWSNVILGLLVLPLALFINGLRIAMIGVVGVNYGNEAGHKFHDYSGYIALIVCFFILFRIARLLGWKD
jgi:exosortase